VVWLDLARVLIAGVILGLVIGKLITRRPYYLRRLHPRFWLNAAKKMRARDWVKLSIITSYFAVLAFFLIIDITILMPAGWLYSQEEYIFVKLAEISLPLLFITVTVLPIFEEWIFRGILLEEAARRTRSRLAGLVISALIFAAFHLSNPGMYPASIIPMTVGGLILGTCYLLGGLASAIVCHSLYNAMLIVI
jgi:membrane protease YdiL (CAAX protease family)